MLIFLCQKFRNLVLLRTSYPCSHNCLDSKQRLILPNCLSCQTRTLSISPLFTDAYLSDTLLVLSEVHVAPPVIGWMGVY